MPTRTLALRPHERIDPAAKRKSHDQLTPLFHFVSAAPGRMGSDLLTLEKVARATGRRLVVKFT